MSRRGSARRSKTRGIVGKVLLITVLTIVLLGLFGAGYLYIRYGDRLKSLYNHAYILVHASTPDTFRACETSECYYSDGSIMQILKAEKDVYYLEYEDIPKEAINALLAVEDRKFYTHKGYDIYAIARAAKAYIENDGEIRQGGSTITQQLARTVFLTNEKTVERKVTEIFTAAQLEKRYSKEDILEFYLNNIYFANGYYGIEAAAKGYFGCGANELGLSQLAFLAGIPNSPNAYNPKTHLEAAIERRDSVLYQMKQINMISEDEYEAALAVKIELKDRPRQRNNYEETFVYNSVVKSIMQVEGFEFRTDFLGEEDKALYAEMYEEEYYKIKRDLFRKGYRIYTSIDKEKQKLLQSAIDEELSGFEDKTDEGVYKLQASGVTIDNDTGFVTAIVGGRTDSYDGYTLNRAYQSPRQPGSSIKPLIVYLPALERGYTPDTIVLDEYFSGGPRNSGDVYSGEITLRRAVTVSKNTVAWKLFCEGGIENGLSYLIKMGFAHISDKDYYPAASLGGLSYGATALEMAGAYATIENEGVYRTPTCVLKVTDSKGEVILDNTDATGLEPKAIQRKRIYKREAALEMTDMLQTVMAEGTGRKMKLDGMSCAGKTGTTTNHKDGWFCGFTPYYTTAVWVGYDYPKTMDDLMGNTYPGQIWKTYMEKIHKGLENRDFVLPADERASNNEADEAEEDLEDSYDLILSPDPILKPEETDIWTVVYGEKDGYGEMTEILPEEGMNWIEPLEGYEWTEPEEWDEEESSNPVEDEEASISQMIIIEEEEVDE